MTVYELPAEQMDELKQNYLTQYLLEVEDRTPSYGELAEASDIVSYRLIYEAYDSTIFYNDDFFCSAE